MAFQLTIAREDLPAAEALRRKEVITLDVATATIGGDGCDCVLAGAQGTRAVVTRLGDGSYEVAPSSQVRLNGKPSNGEKSPLHSGDTLTTDGWTVQFHIRMESVPQSWRSAFLAVFAKTAIVLIILAVGATMFWLPNFLRSSSRWTRFATLEQLSLTLDAERRHARKVEKAEGRSTLNTLLLEEIRDELDDCVRHVRAHEATMTAEQHGKMLQKVRRLADELERIENGQGFPPLPSPALEQAVKNILTHKRLSDK